jgi:hypothetical protein
MGLNGIGVVAFFNLAAADEFITVDGLRILGNEIRGCLRRPLAPIPSDMIDAMGYGGISLADVENLVVEDNIVEDNGPNHHEPICGIFVLHGEGIDITHNRIVNNGRKTSAPSHAAKDGRRGGINIVLAIAPTVPTPIFDVSFPNQNGVPAAKIHENVVSQPLGQALSIGALGSVSVLDNHFTSRGMLLRLSPLSPSFLAATVAIFNLGVSNEIYKQLTGFSGVLSGGIHLTTGAGTTDSGLAAPREGLDDARKGQYLANGNVLFADNRCELNLLETEVGFAATSILIVSLDDVGFHDNQCDCNLLVDFVVAHAVVLAVSLRMSDNRFKEGILNAALSAVTMGIMNATTNNQSTHCLLVQGAKDTAHSPPLWNFEVNTGNRVALTAAIPNLCGDLRKGIDGAGGIGSAGGGIGTHHMIGDPI